MKTILIVDDSVTVRQQIRIALTNFGYNIVEADDGRSGMLMLQRSGVSLVICDINMRLMNGLEMLKSLKGSPRFAAIPVIMLTSERSPELIERARKAGASGWIVKPFDAAALLVAVGKLISV